MNYSFLLRDQAGCVSGYLMQCEESVKCKVSARTNERLLLTVFCENGSMISYSDFGDGREHEWKNRIPRITGAVVTSDEKLIFSTGETARNRWLKAPVEKNGMCKKYDYVSVNEKHVNTAVRTSGAKQEKRDRNWPERRWPPPPCVTDAYYDHGIWTWK